MTTLTTRFILMGSTASLLALLGGCGGRTLGGGEAGESGSEGESSSATTTAETGESTGPACTDACAGEVIAEGISQCEDGSFDRFAAGSFDPTIPGEACIGDEPSLLCMSDADCVDGANGRCLHLEVEQIDSGLIEIYCGCKYSCADDSECADDRLCVPPGVVEGTPEWPSCIKATCKTNDDCGECGECGIGAYNNGCGWSPAASCRAADDECRSSADCMSGTCDPRDGAWACEGAGCVPGRPLLVDGHARRARPRPRADWAVELALEPDGELASYWAEVAALEHASVASFARFGQQLLALGAPAELVLACKAAARDELVHAGLAYGLASAYGRRALGPGSLALDGVRVGQSRAEILLALIREACVGETLNVAEAVAAAERARSPLVRAIALRIARDELRHAELAWRSLAWLLETSTPELRARGYAELDRAVASVRSGADAGPLAGGLHRPEAGVIGGRARAQVHAEASRSLLEPLRAAIVAGASPLEPFAGLRARVEGAVERARGV